MVNSAAICKDSAGGHIHAAIVFLDRNEAGLFTVAAAFGLGFSGIIPAYVPAVRELFLASEA